MILDFFYLGFITKPSKRRSQGFKRTRALTRRIYLLKKKLKYYVFIFIKKRNKRFFRMF